MLKVFTPFPYPHGRSVFSHSGILDLIWPQGWPSLLAVLWWLVWCDSLWPVEYSHSWHKSLKGVLCCVVAMIRTSSGLLLPLQLGCRNAYIESRPQPNLQTQTQAWNGDADLPTSQLTGGPMNMRIKCLLYNVCHCIWGSLLCSLTVAIANWYSLMGQPYLLFNNFHFWYRLS